jgi:hypothetical protein
MSYSIDSENEIDHKHVLLNEFDYRVNCICFLVLIRIKIFINKDWWSYNNFDS